VASSDGPTMDPSSAAAPGRLLMTMLSTIAL
jgi:hypothetical protein